LNTWIGRARSIGQSAPVAIAALIVANAVPLLGVLYFGWDVPTILIVYWLENGVVGLLNVAKILLARGAPDGRSVNGHSGNVVLAAFFLAHYGLFWFVHGVFVFAITGYADPGFVDLANPIRTVLADPGLLFAAVVLLVSHGVSLALNYIGRGEYLTASAGRQMWAPYPRMFVLHITIVFAGVFIIGMDQPEFAIVLLVVLKTALDLVLHLREHGKRANDQGTAGPKGMETTRAG
jgi:hypothetical protein